MLELSDRMDQDSFANRLIDQRLLAQNLTNRRQVRDYSRRLLVSGGPVESAACTELTRVYYGFVDCLQRIANSNLHEIPTREYANERWIKQSRSEPQMLKELLQDPVDFTFAQHALDYSRTAIFQELEMIVDHPDADVRRLACEALRRYYLRQKVAACAAKAGD